MPSLTRLLQPVEARPTAENHVSTSGHDSPRVTTATELPKMRETDKRKQNLYFPEAILREIGDEATRQDRSLSWIVQQAWRTARKEIKSMRPLKDIRSGDDKGASP